MQWPTAPADATMTGPLCAQGGLKGCLDREEVTGPLSDINRAFHTFSPMILI
jgi:hypothetical protein